MPTFTHVLNIYIYIYEYTGDSTLPGFGLSFPYPAVRKPSNEANSKIRQLDENACPYYGIRLVCSVKGLGGWYCQGGRG